MARNDLHSLKELAQVVTRNKVKSVDILSKKGPETKIYDFYERLLDDSFSSDEEAAAYFYQDDSHHPQYRKLKNKLKEKLINTSFFIDANNPKFNTHQAAFYTCQKNLMAVRTLLGRYARTPAIEIALDTLKKSAKFEFSDVSFELSKLLRAHFAIHVQNRTLYDKYANLASYYHDLTTAEDLAAERYDHICIVMKNMNDHEQIIELCEKYEKELGPYLETYDSYRLHLLYYFIALKRLDLRNDPDTMIRLCDKAIHFFSSKGFVSSQFIGAFYYNKLMALIQKKDFAQGNILAQKCSGIFEENSIRWYNAQGYCLIFSLYSGNYSKAFRIREKVVNSRSFQHQFQNREETWRLYDAYLHYLYLCGKLNLPKNALTSSFRIQKFINEVPVHSMDKSRYNIPILIIQILIQIHQRKFDQLTDKIEAIEKYTSRYLRKDNNYRSNCFIKMLLQIPKQHFHRVAVERHTKSLLGKLRAMPLEKAQQPFEIEIIPYEQLWEMALDSLG